MDSVVPLVAASHIFMHTFGIDHLLTSIHEIQNNNHSERIVPYSAFETVGLKKWNGTPWSAPNLDNC